MSMMSNSVMLIGRPDRNVYASDGKVEFNLLVTEKIQDSKTLKWKSSTQSIRCVCYNEILVSKMDGRVQREKRIVIDGRLIVDKDSKCEIIIQDFFLIDKPEN